jgi:lipopolysaccharide/colanic/teichoic acid biosynthesis glycosyltransferase
VAPCVRKRPLQVVPLLRSEGPETAPLTRAVRIVKRLIDLLAGAIGLPLTAAILPFVAVAIYIDSPGPIFYRQRRAGRLFAAAPIRFEEFEMLKLRTMRPDAERLSGPVLASEHDPRVTRVGRILRKTRLDELPQFWNVLIGDMSLVGPRPERPDLLANLTLAIPFFEERLRGVKPGITGLAQVSLGYNGRPEEGSAEAALACTFANPFHVAEAVGAPADDMRMKMLFDLAYVASLERFSTFLATELSVIARTPLVMLRGVGR